MRARRRVRSLLRVAAATAPFAVLALAPAALAAPQDVTPYTQSTPVPVQCGFTMNPASGCGQWTYWMALGAIILGLLLVALVVFGYLRLAPGFAAAAPAPAPPPPPGPPRRAPAMAAAAAAPSASTALAAAPAAPATAPESGPAPPPRRAPEVEPDEETYARVLAEQLAQGVDRRMAESRARAAAVRAARAKAGL